MGDGGHFVVFIGDRGGVHFCVSGARCLCIKYSPRTELAHSLQERCKQYLLSIPQTIRKHMNLDTLECYLGNKRVNLMTPAGDIQSQ